MSDQANVAEVIEETTKELPRVTLSGRILNACVEAGLSVPEVSKALKLNRDYAYHAAKISRQYDVTSPVFHRLAARRIKSLLKMEPIVIKDQVLDKDMQLVETTKHLYPKHSDSLGAAKEVLDRTQPKQQETGSTSISFFQINFGGVDKGD